MNRKDYLALAVGLAIGYAVIMVLRKRQAAAEAAAKRAEDLKTLPDAWRGDSVLEAIWAGDWGP